MLETPRGTPLSQTLAMGDSIVIEAAASCGKALAVLHRLREIPGTKASGSSAARAARSLQTALDWVDEATGVDRAIAARLAVLLAQVPRIDRVTVRRLSPRHVLWGEDGIAFTRVEGLGIGHPLLDAADFCARLLTSVHDHQPLAEMAAAAFRDAYSRHVPASWARHLSVVEAAALLRAWTRQSNARAMHERAAALLAELDEVQSR